MMTALTWKQGRRWWLSSCLAGLLSFVAASAGPALAGDSELHVVVHPSNGAASLERALLADIFLKKITRWPNGEATKPVDLRPDSPARRRFSESVLRRSVGAVRSYWQQRIFSGRDIPPPEVDSETAVVAFVAKNPGAIGYVSSGTKLSGVRELVVK